MMKRKLFAAGIFSFMLIFGLVLTGCSTDGDGGDSNSKPNNEGTTNTDTNPFKGTWTNEDIGTTLIVGDTTWSITTPLGDDSGTYTYSGNNATLTRASGGKGTAKVSGNTLTATFTGANAGTYTVYK